MSYLILLKASSGVMQWSKYEPYIIHVMRKSASAITMKKSALATSDNKGTVQPEHSATNQGL